VQVRRLAAALRAANLVIDTTWLSPQSVVDRVVAYLQRPEER